MAKLTVYGASDDLVELDGIDGADEFSIGNKDSWTGVLVAPNGETALLYVDYRRNGCWTTALGLYEEDYSLPDWPVTITVDAKNGSSYSTYMTVEVPDGTTVKEWND